MPSYLWPTTSPCPVLTGYRLVVLGLCACLSSICVQNLPTGRSPAMVWRLTCIVCRSFLLTFYVSWFSISHSPEELGFIWYWVLHFFWPVSWLPSFPTILLCHSCCNDSILLSFFRPAILLFPPVAWYGHWFSYLWAPVSLLSSSWASLTHLLFLGFLSLFTNSVFSWVFTNFIGLPWPNYLIFIIGVHGPAINPLLYLFALLWNCGVPFSLFYIIYCPWVCYFSLSRLL